MSGIRYRPGRVADVPNAIPLLAPERNCFSSRIWNQLPELIVDLLARGLAKSYVIEESATGRLRWFGLSAFPSAEAMRATLDLPSLPFREVLLQTALDGRAPFLSRQQIAAANAASDLLLTVLLCRPDVGEFTQQQGALLFRMAYDSFCFAHAGFGLSEFWQEVGDSHRARMLEDLGLVRHRQLEIENGAQLFLLKYTAERALANPACAMSLVFNCPPPRFGFSWPQQELLESALLDLPDHEFAASHGLSDDAVKKRWRAIYDRVALVDAPVVETAASGPNQRRMLLGYLRQHLEELRPYKCARRKVHSVAALGGTNPGPLVLTFQDSKLPRKGAPENRRKLAGSKPPDWLV